jgi:hypothetical protein
VEKGVEKGLDKKVEKKEVSEGLQHGIKMAATGATTLGRGMNQMAYTVVGATSNIASTVIGTTTNIVEGATDLVVGVAAITPGLSNLVKRRVHSGFWAAYSVVRDDLHAILRRELKKQPSHLYFIGHSLGGALATIAALDVTINTTPRVNKYLKNKRNALALEEEGENSLLSQSNQRGSAASPVFRKLAETLSFANLGHLLKKEGLGLNKASLNANNGSGSKEPFRKYSTSKYSTASKEPFSPNRKYSTSSNPNPDPTATNETNSTPTPNATNESIKDENANQDSNNPTPNPYLDNDYKKSLRNPLTEGKNHDLSPIEESNKPKKKGVQRIKVWVMVSLGLALS